MPDRNVERNLTGETVEEREVEAASGEVIKFRSSKDADEYQRAVDHLRIIKGINTAVLDVQYETDNEPNPVTELSNLTQNNSEPGNVLNLEGLTLPKFVTKLRQKRMIDQLAREQRKKAA